MAANGIDRTFTDHAVVDVDPAHPALRSKRYKGGMERLHIALAQVKTLLGEDHNTAAFRRFISQRSQLCGVSQRFFIHALRRDKLRRLTVTECDGAGFIERDDLHLAGFFERNGSFKQDAVFRAHAAAYHDGDRRREAKCARAADDEHGDAARERVAERLPNEHPDDERNNGDADDGRDEHAGNLIGDLRNRCFRGSGIADHADNLGKRGIFSNARCFAAQEAGLVHGRGGNSIAHGLIDRNALAGEGGFVDGAGAFQDNAVYGDILTGTHDEHIAAANLGNGHGDLLTVPHEHGGFRREVHETL